YGYHIYYGMDSGPVLNTMYGPVHYLSYLPAALAKSPTIAILIGELLTVLFYFLPVFWLHIGEHLHPSKINNLRFACYIFILFCVLTTYLSPLSSCAFMIHSDAPALGFCAIACAILYYRKRNNSIVSLLLSATFSVLAVWTKQTTIPILFALPTYILLANGINCFIRYLLCIGVSGLVISSLILVFSDSQALIFNMLIIPSHQPWIGLDTGLVPAWSLKGLLSLIELTQNLINYSIGFLIIIILFICYQLYFSSNKEPQKIQIWFRDNPWVMLVMIALFMVPTLLLALVKIGGNVNNYAFTLYFLITATNLVLIKTVSDSTVRYKQLTQKAVKLIVFIMIIALSSVQIPELTSIFARLPKLANNPQQVAYEFAKKHPGEAYFPWNPLSSLMAEGKLYHIAYGLYDMKIAGFNLSNQNFRAYIPPHIKYVAFTEKLVIEDTLRYLPEFSKQVTVDELPGWTVYTRS
ncbi:hypothetical protein, partial [Allocoleopsis sp.]|uniref:hypothetical protein n=1 Tax=Allocoleopsis sp. TaxID=3088169 RepID=UPI002FCE82D8